MGAGAWRAPVPRVAELETTGFVRAGVAVTQGPWDARAATEPLPLPQPSWGAGSPSDTVGCPRSLLSPQAQFLGPPAAGHNFYSPIMCSMSLPRQTF